MRKSVILRYRLHAVVLVAGWVLLLVPTWLRAQVVSARAVLEGHAGPVRSLAFSPNGATLASGGGASSPKTRDAAVCLWQLSTGKRLGTLEELGKLVRCVGFGQDGGCLAAGGEFGLKVWIGNLKDRSKVYGPRKSIADLAFSPDGKIIAAAANGQTVLYSVASGETLASPPGHRAPEANIQLAFSPDGKTLVSGGGDNVVRLWDIARQTPMHERFFGGHQYGIASLAISPEGKWLATGAADKLLKGPSRPDGDIIIWDFASGEKAATLHGHTSEVASLALHRDGKRLASASKDGTVRIWDIDARKEIAILRDHKGPVRAAAFSPDGKTLATGGDDKTIRLWDVK